MMQAELIDAAKGFILSVLLAMSPPHRSCQGMLKWSHVYGNSARSKQQHVSKYTHVLTQVLTATALLLYVIVCHQAWLLRGLMLPPPVQEVASTDGN
jgi:hypothetical protein